MSVCLSKTVTSTLNASTRPGVTRANVRLAFTEMVQHASKVTAKILTVHQTNNVSLQGDLVNARRDSIVMNQKSVSMSTSVKIQMNVIRTPHAQTPKEAIFAYAKQVFTVLVFHASRANVLMLLVPGTKHALPQLLRVIVQRG